MRASQLRENDVILTKATWVVQTKNKIVGYRWWIVGAVAVVAIALQLLVGNFPIDVVRFPLNVVIATLWLVALTSLYKRRATSALAQFMLSRKSTWLSLSIMVLLGIMLGLQIEPMTESWPVVVAILFVLSHLVLVLMRGWRTTQGIRWRFTLLHTGLLLALGAGFWGAADREQLRILTIQDIPTDEAYDLSGQINRLDYQITLTDFQATYYDNGTPSTYRATIEVDEEQQSLEVNHPYDYSWSETIYLISHGIDPRTQARYCILEIVNEPWQWLSMSGLLMLIMGAILLFIGGPRQSNTHKQNCVE